MKRSLVLVMSGFLGLMLIATAQAQPVEVAKLLAEDGGSNDEFGYSLSVSGDVAVVGALDHDSKSYVGSAYIYRFDGSSWIQETKLTPADGKDGTDFGSSVGIFDNTVVVGADGGDAAYVYEFDGSSWIEQANLTASDGELGDSFGWSVAIFGDTVVVGAFGDNDNGINSGSAYVFRFDGLSWTQEAKLTAPDLTTDDYFGRSVAISGDTIVVGALGSGSAYVFRFNGSNWTQEAKLLATNIGERRSIAISGDMIVAGAAWDDDHGTGSGAAYVYQFGGSTWNEDAKITASDGAAYDNFGNSVAFFGDKLLIGALYGNNDSGAQSGSAYIYVFDGSSWTGETKLTASDGEAGEQFGYSVAISGNTAVVGARLDDDNDYHSGSAYVFDLILIKLPCPADANQDGLVDPLDIGFVVSRFGCTYPQDGENCLYADANGDTIVDPLDQGFVLARFGSCP